MRRVILSYSGSGSTNSAAVIDAETHRLIEGVQEVRFDWRPSEPATIEMYVWSEHVAHWEECLCTGFARTVQEACTA